MNFDIGDLMKQAGALQDKMKQAQEQLAAIEVTGEAGAGMVSVVMNGRHDVRSVKIEPSLLQEPVTVLQDMLAAAVNDAVQKVEASNRDNLGSLFQGMPVPPGFKP